MVLAAAAFLASGAATARASIPDAGGIIHACYTNRTGVLRIIDNSIDGCRAGETALAWGQQGPQGPQGSVGPAGPTGASGPAGPDGITDAYIARQEGLHEFLDPFHPSTPHVILSLPVPAGSYVIQARAIATSPFENISRCYLNTGDRTVTQTETAGGVPSDPRGGALVLQDAASFDSDTTIELSCNGFGYGVSEAVLTATKVTTIH